jgi:hypothetical protein
VDGGVRNVTPLNAAFQALAELEDEEPGPSDRTPDTIYVLLASPLRAPVVFHEDKLDSGIDIGKRSLELLVDEVYANDLQLALTINESLAYFERIRAIRPEMPAEYPFEGYRYVNIVVIQPERLHMDSLEFDPAKVRQAFVAGRLTARAALERAEMNSGSNVNRDSYARESVVLRG